MPCRLQNVSRHPLRVDLRGGKCLDLKPGQTSPLLPDELLYRHNDLPRLIRAGLVHRVEVPPSQPQPRAPEPSQPIALEEVKGIGKVVGDRLRDAGIPHVAALVRRKPERVVEACGLSLPRVRKILKQARALLREPRSASQAEEN